MRPLPLAALAACLLAAALPADALAAPPGTKPSNAQTVQVNATVQAAEDNGAADVWRLGRAVSPGEELQMAVDNTQGTATLYVCVLGAVDDFDYDDEVDRRCESYDDDSEAWEGVSSGRSSRVTLPYRGSTGQPLIRFSSSDDNVDVYNFKVERIIPIPPPAPPDTDDDGIIDANDGCPQSTGPAPSGCPDDDADGIPNTADACESTKGVPSAAGCPDGDLDGVRDTDDKCPSATGVAPSGCPDADGDGVLDADDRCATRPGRTANGCPERLRFVSSVSLKRKGRNFSGRIVSPDASCKDRRRVILRKVGGGNRIYGVARSRPNGTFTIRPGRRLRGRYYAVAAERTLTTKQCRSGKSRNVRGR